MVILKKIVIMTEYKNSNVSGIVKFENFAGRTSCFVRILGLGNKGELCIKCGEDIMYCGSLVEGEMKFSALYDLTKPIYIAVAKDGAIVSMGSNTGRFSPSVLSGYLYQYYANGQVQNADADNVSNANSENSVQAEENTDNSEKQEEDLTQSVSQEDKNVDENVTVQQNVQADTQEEKPKKKSQTKVQEPFYKQIENSMQELFEKYESEEELNLLVPDSKWVRVPVDGQSYYVVGLIYSEDKPNLICYGVPDKDDSNPPQNSNECRQWLELEKGGRGYWMMYQSAISGQTLTTNII